MLPDNIMTYQQNNKTITNGNKTKDKTKNNEGIIIINNTGNKKSLLKTGLYCVCFNVHCSLSDSRIKKIIKPVDNKTTNII